MPKWKCQPAAKSWVGVGITLAPWEEVASSVTCSSGCEPHRPRVSLQPALIPPRSLASPLHLASMHPSCVSERKRMGRGSGLSDEDGASKSTAEAGTSASLY